MGRPSALRAERSARHARTRAPHDRDRAAGARRHRRGAEGGLHALRAARAARRRVHGRGLELSVPHRREQRGAGADGGQRRDPQAFGADAAVRRALRECLAGRGSAGGRVPGSASSHEDTDRIDPRSARRLRRVHRLGGRRPRRAARRGGALHRRRASSSAAAIRCTCATTPISRTPSRTSSTARTSIPASPAAACSASTCTSGSTTQFVDGFVELTRKYVLGNPLEAGHHARPGGAHRGGRRRARADRRRRSRPARKAVIDEAQFPASRSRHAVSRAAGAAGRRSPHAGDARGDLRARSPAS